MNESRRYKIRKVITGLLLCAIVLGTVWYFQEDIKSFVLGARPEDNMVMTFKELQADDVFELAENKGLDVFQGEGIVSTETPTGNLEEIPFAWFKVSDKAPYGEYFVKIDDAYNADEECTYQIGFKDTSEGFGMYLMNGNKTLQQMKEGTIFYISDNQPRMTTDYSIMIKEIPPAEKAAENDFLDAGGDLYIEYIGDWKIAIWPKEGEFNYRDFNIEYYIGVEILGEENGIGNLRMGGPDRGGTGCSGVLLANKKFIYDFSWADYPQQYLDEYREGARFTIREYEKRENKDGTIEWINNKELIGISGK